mmetsp:Transcript_15864/g.36570  ORF Transcript_15864/g.36570 Transcript_15864/m.36570 type:complete len:472 (+) Transcript_15864:286-1701(+)|eukprot:CAMPEP_0172405928 /NCGR_PEP_ID=MMETSP1061-20121228/68689_1 /TAXON_ID=37318 /ORGANISM="Pseudo-nitzschia pungens, Strain cf. pungens" /LENGTH=471 /DNA_ID=CAMNT_0013141311 /DNA_START=240 /DNA_END=1655 /DNA_ORIENTATION=-
MIYEIATRRNSAPDERDHGRRGVPLPPIYENERVNDLDGLQPVPLQKFMSQTILSQLHKWKSKSSVAVDTVLEEDYGIGYCYDDDHDHGDGEDQKDGDSNMSLQIIVDNARSYVQSRFRQRSLSAHSVMMLANNRWKNSDSLPDLQTSTSTIETSASLPSLSSLVPQESSFGPRSVSLSPTLKTSSKPPLKSCLKSSMKGPLKVPLKSCLKKSSVPLLTSSLGSSLKYPSDQMLPTSSSANNLVSQSDHSVSYASLRAERRWGNGSRSSSLSHSASDSSDTDDGSSVESCSSDSEQTTREIITQAEAVVEGDNYRTDYHSLSPRVSATRRSTGKSGFTPPTIASLRHFPTSLIPKGIEQSLESRGVSQVGTQRQDSALVRPSRRPSAEYSKEGAPVRPERVPSMDAFSSNSSTLGLSSKQRKARDANGGKNFQWTIDSTAPTAATDRAKGGSKIRGAGKPCLSTLRPCGEA